MQASLKPHQFAGKPAWRGCRKQFGPASAVGQQARRCGVSSGAAHQGARVELLLGEQAGAKAGGLAHRRHHVVKEAEGRAGQQLLRQLGAPLRQQRRQRRDGGLPVGHRLGWRCGKVGRGSDSGSGGVGGGRAAAPPRMSCCLRAAAFQRRVAWRCWEGSGRLQNGRAGECRESTEPTCKCRRLGRYSSCK